MNPNPVTITYPAATSAPLSAPTSVPPELSATLPAVGNTKPRG
jgi:hypothetical protein